MKFNAILFNILEQCNIRCKHCGYAGSSRGRTMNEGTVNDWVAQAVDYGIPHVIFTGGEPFLDINLLKTGVGTAFRRGATAGVFTNGLWAESFDTATTILNSLNGLDHLYLSCDVYHIQFVPLAFYENIVKAAKQLGIKIIICITYAKEEDKSIVTKFFDKYSDYLGFNYLPVIPNDFIRRLIPDVDANETQLIHTTYSNRCFLHTPLIDPEGNVCTCHLGKAGTNTDIKKLPYYLGSLYEKSLNAIFDAAESNGIYQFLRVFGPKGLAETISGSSIKEVYGDKCYSGACHMCADLLPKTEVIDALSKRLDDPMLQNEIFLRRIIELNDC